MADENHVVQRPIYKLDPKASFPRTSLGVPALSEQARKSSEDAQAGYAQFEKVWTQNTCILGITFGKYTFEKFTFGKYTFGKYTFGKYTFRKYTKIIGVLSLQLFT